MNPHIPLMTTWLQRIHEWFPNLHNETYFLPPVHFNRVPYDYQAVGGEQVLVAHKAAGATSSSQSVIPRRSKKSQQPLPVQDSDVRDDKALRSVLRGLRTLADKLGEVMVVVSQLQFGNYLNKPTYAAAASLFKRPSQMAQQNYHQGDFDVLLLNKQYGLITGEIKSVGDNFQSLNKPEQELDAILATIVEKAVAQMKKSKDVLEFLVSDLPDVKVITILMLPNVSSTQLLRTLNSHPAAGQALCSCLGVTTTEEAVKLCLCSDQLSSLDTFYNLPDSVLTELCQWWEHQFGRVQNKLSRDCYEQLLARFCGPATLVDVYCITPPRLELRTKGEAVSEAGNRIAQICLYPDQVHVMNSANPRVYLTGPPGTGKTLMLYLKGVEWLKGDDVHILNTCQNSRASSFMLENQLLQYQLLQTGSTGMAAARPTVIRHDFDFFDEEDDIHTAISVLWTAACNGKLFILADEVDEEFNEFCSGLVKLVPDVHLWAASMYNNNIPQQMTEKKVTVALRSPPIIVKEVERDKEFGRFVHNYTLNGVPSPTDGPAISRLKHRNTKGHTEGWGIDDCEQCGLEIARVLGELNVDVTGQSTTTNSLQLQCRDVVVLCNDPNVDLLAFLLAKQPTLEGRGLVRGLRAAGVAVQVVEKDASNDEIRDLALLVNNKVTVTVYENIKGLERKVVVVSELDKAGTDFMNILTVSRCTSQLVVIDYQVHDGLAASQEDSERDDPLDKESVADK